MKTILRSFLRHCVFNSLGVDHQCDTQTDEHNYDRKTMRLTTRAKTRSAVSGAVIYMFIWHINNWLQQWTITEQFGDWYIGSLWLCCYIWYSEEWLQKVGIPFGHLLAVLKLTNHPSKAKGSGTVGHVPCRFDGYLSRHVATMGRGTTAPILMSCPQAFVTRTCDASRHCINRSFT